MIRFAVFFIAGLVAACAEKQVDAPAPKPALVFSPKSCDFQPDSTLRLACFSVKRTRGSRHQYSYVMLQNTESKSPMPRSAVVLLPGGPGQGAQTSSEWLQLWSEFLSKNNLDSDFIVFDPPSTLGSSAFWRCNAYEERALSILSEDVSLEQEESELAKLSLACMQKYDSRLKQKAYSEAGIHALSSLEYKERVSLFLDALDYEKIHLLGISYGSRLALLLAEHPKVASLTLDSLYPFSRGTLSDLPEVLANAAQRHEAEYFSRYKQSYRDVFVRAQDVLSQAPQTVTIDMWDGSGTANVLLNARRLYDLEFSVLYDERDLSDYYRALRNIEVDPKAFAWPLELQINSAFDPDFSSLTFFATECQDNALASRKQFNVEVNKYPHLDVDWDTYFDLDLCRNEMFKRSHLVQNQTYIEKPTLILSGELDPITLPRWGNEVTSKVAQSRQFVVSRVGHGVLLSEGCNWSLLNEYWASEVLPEAIRCEETAD